MFTTAQTPVEIKIRNYGNYSSDNYGSCREVQIGRLVLFFSYETVVAFSTPKTGLIICKNVWSKTTGRHLNCISSDKSRRREYDEFQQLLQQYVIDEYGLDVT